MTPLQALIILIRLFSLLTFARVSDGVSRRVMAFSEHPESFSQFAIFSVFVLYLAVRYYRDPLPAARLLARLILPSKGTADSTGTHFGDWFAIGRTLLGLSLVGESIPRLATAIPLLTSGTGYTEAVSHCISGLSIGVCGLIFVMGWPRGSTEPLASQDRDSRQ
jgi:hypothetical protein